MMPSNPLAGANVGSLMVSLSAFVGSRDLVTHARALMRERGVKVLPVVDGGRLEGILTQRDIIRVTSTRSNIPVVGVMAPIRLLITPSTELSKAVRGLVELGLDEIPVVQSPSNRVVVGVLRMEDILRKTVSSLGPGPKVGEIMTREVITCQADQEISSVWDLMEKEELSGLPVVEREGGKTKVVGMVTRTDLIGSGTARVAEESRKGRKPPKVRSVMRSPVTTISPDEPVSKAIELMLAKGVKRLPVVSEGNLVGIVSRADVVRAVYG